MKATTIFESIDECISFARDAQTTLPSINALIDDKDFQKWTEKLSGCSDFEKFICESHFNLLNTLIIKGLADKRHFSNPTINHINVLLAKVNMFLNSFPELESDNSFKAKIKNIDGLNFLSTLSELSLAHHLKSLGFSVIFEKRFTQNLSNKKRDIDLTVRQDSEEFNIEVYMPNKQTDIEGFFDPFQDDSHFKEKIKSKLFTKFGRDGIVGLNGKTVLAINKIFFDMMHLKTVFPIFNNVRMNDDLINFLPPNIDGLLFFEDEFGYENSFRFEKLIQKIN